MNLVCSFFTKCFDTRILLIYMVCSCIFFARVLKLETKKDLNSFDHTILRVRIPSLALKENVKFIKKVKKKEEKIRKKD